MSNTGVKEDGEMEKENIFALWFATNATLPCVDMNIAKSGPRDVSAGQKQKVTKPIY